MWGQTELSPLSNRLVRIAPQRESQRSTHLIHPRGTELRHTFPESLLRYRDCIVQVHRAEELHAVILIQHDFRWHAANSGSNRRDRDRG